jgi:hypothetical protein
MKFCLTEHRGYISNDDDTATGKHFNSAGHTISDLSITILEEVKRNGEIYFISKFNTFYRGVNCQP